MNPSRLPPQDLDAERSLLGSMLLQSNNYGEIAAVLPRECVEAFMDTSHRTIWTTLWRMYEKGKKIDMVTVRNALGAKLKDVGGVEYIVELAESVPTHHHADAYARIVRDFWLCRELAMVCTNVYEEAHGHVEDVAEFLDRAEQRLFQVTQNRNTRESKPENVLDALQDVFKGIEAARSGTLPGIHTGIMELDGLTGGLQNGEMTVVAGRPSMGKSSLALCQAIHIAVNEHRPVAFFSLEMSRFDLMKRMLSVLSGVDAFKVRRGMLTDRDVSELKRASKQLEQATFFIDDKPGLSPMELRGKCRDLHRRHGIAAVFVDYLQLMRIPGRQESRQVEVSKISAGIKELARELAIPIVVMAQLKRPEGGRVERPRMSDLRESGSIEQDADAVLLIHRQEYYDRENCDEKLKGVAELILDKQRNGPTGTVKAHWDAATTRFTNLSASSYEGYREPAAEPTIYDQPGDYEPEPEPVSAPAGSGNGEVPF